MQTITSLFLNTLNSSLHFSNTQGPQKPDKKKLFFDSPSIAHGLDVGLKGQVLWRQTKILNLSLGLAPGLTNPCLDWLKGPSPSFTLPGSGRQGLIHSQLK
ncbi:hypothetical protein AMTRI_Chr06g177610 [Amborella trichopoda]